MSTPTEPPEQVPVTDLVEPPPAPRRRRVVFWTAVVVALTAAGAGGYVAVSAYLVETAPETVVLDYLDAVARGDAVAALAYGDLPAGKPDLLTTEVLAAQRAIAPISRITVDVAVGPGDTGTARVRYDLGFATGAQSVDDSIPLVRTGRTWRLAATAVPVTIDIVNARNRATVAGAEVPYGEHLVFPGALPVAFDTENLGLAEASRVVRFAQDSPVAEVAELTSAGEEAVGAGLDTTLEACLDGTAPALTLCPLPADARAVPGSLRGTLGHPASEDAVVRTQTGNDGLVRITVEITITGEYQQLDFTNQRAVMAGDFTVGLVAVCYATSPESIIWRAA